MKIEQPIIQNPDDTKKNVQTKPKHQQHNNYPQNNRLNDCLQFITHVYDTAFMYQKHLFCILLKLKT